MTIIIAWKWYSSAGFKGWHGNWTKIKPNRKALVVCSLSDTEWSHVISAGINMLLAIEGLMLFQIRTQVQYISRVCVNWDGSCSVSNSRIIKCLDDGHEMMPELKVHTPLSYWCKGYYRRYGRLLLYGIIALATLWAITVWWFTMMSCISVPNSPLCIRQLIHGWGQVMDALLPNILLYLSR